MELKESIIRTIAFFDLFDYPLTPEEIREFLYGYPKRVGMGEIKDALGQLGGVVDPIRDWVVLKGRERLIDVRKSRKFIAEKLWGRVRQYGQYVASAPFVEMVAVCNNLAYDNPSEQSDIDLFIVIKPGRMWLARLWVTLVLQFFGVRRHGDKIIGRFCLSFFATPPKMAMGNLALMPEDPYLAYWTRLLAPVYGDETYRQFVIANSGWIASRAGLGFSESAKRQLVFPKKSSFGRFMEKVLGGWLGNKMESWIRSAWFPRTSKKASVLGPEASVVVSDDLLKFHNKDRRKEYYDRWISLVEKALSNQESQEKNVEGSPFGSQLKAHS